MDRSTFRGMFRDSPLNRSRALRESVENQGQESESTVHGSSGTNVLNRGPASHNPPRLPRPVLARPNLVHSGSSPSTSVRNSFVHRGSARRSSVHRGSARRGSVRRESVGFSPIRSGVEHASPKPPSKVQKSMRRRSKVPLVSHRPDELLHPWRREERVDPSYFSSSSSSIDAHLRLPSPVLGMQSGEAESRYSFRARPSSPPRYKLKPEYDDTDVADHASITQSPPPAVLQKFVIGIDFGTTNSSVAYVMHGVDERNPRISPKEVKYVLNWPQDGNGGARAQVPTELVSNLPLREFRELALNTFCHFIC